MYLTVLMLIPLLTAEGSLFNLPQVVDVVPTNSVHDLSKRDEEEFVVRIETANITLMNVSELFTGLSVCLPDEQDDTWICVAKEVSTEQEEDTYIVRMAGQPMSGLRAFLNVRLCSKPGNQLLPGRPAVWDCGMDYVFIHRNPPLQVGHECVQDDDQISYGELQYQHQGAAGEFSSLSLPSGTGARVGGKTGPRYVVFDIHYPRRSWTADGTHSGNSFVDVTLVRNSPPRRLVSSFSILVNGFVAANSIGSVTGSFTLRNETEIQLLLLYPHAHLIGTEIRIAIERKNGSRSEVLVTDPQIDKGIYLISGRESAVMRKGDRFTIQCTYNNTRHKTLRVESAEHCTANVYYSVKGNKTLDTVEVFSNDGRYQNCWHDFSVAGVENNYEAHSSYTGPVTDDECFVWH